MTTAATSLLGLALPVTGELSGTWGDTVNNSITALLDSAVAGTTTLSADADVTLTTTTLAANQAREAIILWTAAGTVTRYITAPAQSKIYAVLNKSSTQSIVLRGVGPTTGVTILAGKQAMVAWDGTDYVEISSGYVDGPATSTDNAVARFDGTDGKLLQNSVVIIADTTGNMTGVGTLATSGTINLITVGRGAGAVASNTVVGGNGALGANTTGSGNSIYGAFSGAAITSGLQNSAFGYGTLNAIVTGTNNSAFGYSALEKSTASSNVAVGDFSQFQNLTGTNNASIGSNALRSNATGSYNTAIGDRSLYLNTASNNTAVGYQAGYTNTTGNQNVFSGNQAGYGATTATNSVFMGHQAGFSTFTGTNAIGIGSLALYSSTSATDVIGIGRNALFTNTSGANNVAVGSSALFSNTTASDNTAVGYYSLYGNTTGTLNAAFGRSALQGNTTGANNVAMGYQALVSNTTSNSNTAIGYQAGYANTAANVTFIGDRAGKANTTGQNTAVGSLALATNTTGDSTTAVGFFALYLNTTGSNNTALGHSALQANTTASNNTAVGYQAGYANTGASNTFLGNASGFTNNSGVQNVNVGMQSGYGNTSGSSNVFVGFNVASNVTVSSNNTAVGYQAMLSTGGSTNGSNSAFGNAALSGITSGSANAVIGSNSGSGITSGNNNVIIGGYTGSAAPISATGSNYIVLSDGAGNVRQYFNGANATFNGNVVVGSGIGNGQISSTFTGVTYTNTAATASQKNVALGNNSGETRYGIESSTGGSIFTGTTAYASVFGHTGAFPVQFITNNTVRGTFDGSGNLGLGVTPSATGTLGGGGRTMFFPSASITNYDDLTSNFQLWMLNNAYRSSASDFKYLKSGFAGEYAMNNAGQHVWYTSGTSAGTAGAAITFTQAMTLTAAGNLGIGTTSPAKRLHAADVQAGDAIRVSGPTSDNAWAGGIEFYSNDATTVTSSLLVSSGGMYFNFGGSQRMRLDNSGNLLVGTTVSPSGTGNIVPAAAKGVNFTGNTGAAGKTSQLLNWYEEGTWTPVQGAGLTVVGTFSSNGRYTRTGRLVLLEGKLSATTSITAAGAAAALCTGLPFACVAGAGSGQLAGPGSTMNGTATAVGAIYVQASTVANITALSATTDIFFSISYMAA